MNSIVIKFYMYMHLGIHLVLMKLSCFPFIKISKDIYILT